MIGVWRIPLCRESPHHPWSLLNVCAFSDHSMKVRDSMIRRVRRHVTPTGVIAVLALVFAMSGGAYAAKKYLISSTKQISPSVLKKLKGTNGKAGPAGTAGPAGPAGPAGAGTAVPSRAP
jgi:hypothetical protein